MALTSIEWTQRTWNPVTGCTKVSPGCDHCYAATMARRLHGRAGYPDLDPFSVTLHPDRLTEPAQVRKPSTFFVCSMGDLFHSAVPWEYIVRVFVAMAATPQHTYQVLTKRPGRMAYFAEHVWAGEDIRNPAVYHSWPANVWAGTSVESQRYAPRLDVLARVPAPVRFVSAEPLLGPLDLRKWLPCSVCALDTPIINGIPTQDAGLFQGARCAACGGRRGHARLSWVIVGGESGPGARPMHPDWARSIRDQCVAADVPYFLKQWGEWGTRLDHPTARVAGDGWGTLEVDGQWWPTTTPWNGHQGEDSPTREYVMLRVGKKTSGALLDGREWRQMPEVACD